MKSFKAIVCVVALLSLVVVGIAALDETPASWVIASNFGDRDYTTVTTVIAQVGSRSIDLYFDEGAWLITNNVTFPTNITVHVVEGAQFSIPTNLVLTFRGGFEAGHYKVFGGLGTATGNGRFLWQKDSWGDSSQYQPGTGDISVAMESSSNFFIAYSDAGDAIVSNGVIEWATNLFIAAPGGTAVIDTVIASNFAYIGASLVIPSGLDEQYGAAKVDSFRKVSNITNINANADFGDFWKQAQQYYAPTKAGQWTANTSFTIDGMSNVNEQSFDMFLVRDAASNDMGQIVVGPVPDHPTNATQLLSLGTGSGPGKILPDITAPGFAAFTVQSGATNNYTFFIRVGQTSQMAFAAIQISYVGDPALAP